MARMPMPLRVSVLNAARLASPDVHPIPGAFRAKLAFNDKRNSGLAVLGFGRPAPIVTSFVTALRFNDRRNSGLVGIF